LAGDWLKVELSTPDKPEVWRMAGILNISADEVVGKLFRVWRWFNEHTEDGNAVGVSYALLDRIAGVTGFAEAMALSGWLTQNGHLLSLPKFDRHNGKSAKNRALTSERVAKHRNAPSVTESLPEKRREEKKEKSTRSALPAPDGVDNQVWEDWLTLRKQKRAPVTATVLDGAKVEALKAGMSLEAFLRVWCRRGSQGLEASWLKPEEKGSQPSQEAARSAAYLREMEEHSKAAKATRPPPELLALVGRIGK
jgi:hypothetical protein